MMSQRPEDIPLPNRVYDTHVQPSFFDMVAGLNAKKDLTTDSKTTSSEEARKILESLHVPQDNKNKRNRNITPVLETPTSRASARQGDSRGSVSRGPEVVINTEELEDVAVVAVVVAPIVQQPQQMPTPQLGNEENGEERTFGHTISLMISSLFKCFRN